MDGIQAGAVGFAAPVVHWRQSLLALLPAAAIIGAYVLAAELPGSQIASTPGNQELIGMAVIWLSLSSFEWCWLKGLADPAQKWWQPLCQFGPPFWIFVVVSSVLFLSLYAIAPVQDYLRIHLGEANASAAHVYFTPTLLVSILNIALGLAWAWIRIRLILWPTDIVITGRLRSPARVWAMTRGNVWEFLGLWLVMAMMAGVAGLFVAMLGYAFLDDSIRPMLWLFAVIYVVAALDAAYLDVYTGARKAAGPLNLPATA